MPLSTGWREEPHVCSPPTICHSSAVRYGRIWVCHCGLQWRIISQYAPDIYSNVKVDYVLVVGPNKINHWENP